MTNVEIVDLPYLIVNESKVSVGDFDEASTEFTHLSIVKNKGTIFIVIADSAGYIT